MSMELVWLTKRGLLESMNYLANKTGITTEEYVSLLIESENIARVSKTFFNN
ncbi:hypothetical protein ABH957_003133 [Bacillus sp. RC242]